LRIRVATRIHGVLGILFGLALGTDVPVIGGVPVVEVPGICGADNVGGVVVDGSAGAGAV